MIFDYTIIYDFISFGSHLIYEIGKLGYALFFTPINTLVKQYDLASLLFNYPWVSNTIGDKSVMFVLLVSLFSGFILVQILKVLIKLFIESGLPLV